MNNPVLISILVMSCIVSIACGNPSKADPPDVQTSDTEQPADQSEEKDPYFVETTTVTSDHGPGSITRNIMQDRNGNIWLATWEGIMRYDGKAFVNFTNKEELKRWRVFALAEDREGLLWFGTVGAGVYRYDGERIMNMTTRDGLVDNRVSCFYEDANSNIWIGTTGGVSLYDGRGFRNFTESDGLTNNDVNTIIQDRSGTFWIGTRGEACTFDGEKFNVVRNDNGMPFTNVRTIIEDRYGNIWLGGNNGLWRYDGKLFRNFATNFTGYIYEDRTGNLWTSAESAENREEWVLSRYDAQSVKSGSLAHTTVLREEEMFFGILEDVDGDIWLGTLNGVRRWNGQSFHQFGK